LLEEPEQAPALLAIPLIGGRNSRVVGQEQRIGKVELLRLGSARKA
jgi:hypothetical protein